jgi:Cysteine rich repeat
MGERAHSVDLDPEIENGCLTDLARYCSDKTQKSQVSSNYLIALNHTLCHRSTFFKSFHVFCKIMLIRGIN